MDAHAADGVLSGHGPILLDFDGPVAHVFAGLPAATAAETLLGVLRERGYVPDSVIAENGPIAVLQWTAHHAADALLHVEEALCQLEHDAVDTATVTSGAAELITRAKRSRGPVAIVSNNSRPAIVRFLDRHGLSGDVACVIGRPYARPEQMKPSPILVSRAVAQLGARPHECVFVGDSLSDMTAGVSAGVRVIGYANKPRKVASFRGRADAVVTSMTQLSQILRLRA